MKRLRFGHPSTSNAARSSEITGGIEHIAEGAHTESPQVPEVNETAGPGDLPSGPGEVTRAPAGDGEGFRQLLELYSRFMHDARSPGQEEG